jgi:hypothetical protein
MVLPDLDVSDTLAQIDTFVFTDPHGEKDMLQYLFRFTGALEKPGTKAKILGDYIDKGLKPRETLDYAEALKKRYGDRLTLLGGNHELAFMQRNYSLAWSVNVFQTETEEIETETVEWLDSEEEAEHMSRRITDMFASGVMQSSEYDFVPNLFFAHAGIDLDIIPYIAEIEPSVLSEGKVNFSELSRYFNETLKRSARKNQDIRVLSQAATTVQESKRPDLRALEDQFSAKSKAKTEELATFYEKHPLFWFRKDIDGKLITGPFWKNAAELFSQYQDRAKEKRELFGTTTSVVGHTVVPYFNKWLGWDVQGIISTPDGSFVAMDGGMSKCFFGNMTFVGITKSGEVIGFVKDSDDLEVNDWYCAHLPNYTSE